ncbi:MAG TPA: MFS transporter, partial [Acidimicrobiales bacterium]
VDRRALVVAVDLARAGVLAVLAAALLTTDVGLVPVLAALFVLGTAEVFADTAAGTLLPMVVDRADLGIGNARLMTGTLVMNEMVGPAAGAALFVAGTAWPFVTEAVVLALGALLVSRMRLPVCERPAERSHVRQDVVEGLRWTWGNAAVRTLTLTIVSFNVTYGAAWSVLVLHADQRLGLGPVGFGLLSTATAIGGFVGTASYDWLERHAGLATLMRVGLVLETLTHLALALTTTAWVGMAVMVVFGAHAFVWSTTSRTVRMRAAPLGLQGRVGSVYSMGLSAASCSASWSAACSPGPVASPGRSGSASPARRSSSPSSGGSSPTSPTSGTRRRRSPSGCDPGRTVRPWASRTRSPTRSRHWPDTTSSPATPPWPRLASGTPTSPPSTR